MKGASDNKFWLWLVVLLVICNLALIATIWLKPVGNGNGFPPPRHGGPGANFNKQLSFTTEQNEKFNQMRQAQQEKIDSLKKAARGIREQFFAVLKTGENNTAQLDSISTVLGNYHKTIELQTYTHFAEVRAMLTDKQKVIFDSIIVDVLHNLPEQPRYKGDGLRRQGPGHPGDGNGPPPPRDERFNDGPPPRRGDGPPPPPPDGDENR